jgi:hypothetical protein
VEVDERRQREAVVAPGRLGLLEVDEVGVGCRVPDALRERTGQLAERAAQSPEARGPRARWLDVDELDGQVGWHLAAGRELPPRGDRVHVDPVRAQSAQQPDRGLAGRAAFGQRRLGEDDERAHGRDRDGSPG